MRGFAFASTIIASSLLLCAFSGSASAVSFIIQDDTSFVPTTSNNPLPTSSSNWSIQTGSVGAQYLSPFAGTPEDGHPYSVVQINGFASYNLPNPGNILTLFWGSPDTYNSITFYGDLNDTDPLFTITGADLVPYGATLGTGHDQVTVTVIGATVASVKLSDGSLNAFEYTNPTATPLPAALPLYAAGVGMIGLLGRRRRKSKQTSAA
jgi:hypothetical protein